MALSCVPPVGDVIIPINIMLADLQLISSYHLDTPLWGAIIKQRGDNRLSGKITDYLEVDPFSKNKGK